MNWVSSPVYVRAQMERAEMTLIYEKRWTNIIVSKFIFLNPILSFLATLTTVVSFFIKECKNSWSNWRNNKALKEHMYTSAPHRLHHWERRKFDRSLKYEGINMQVGMQNMPHSRHSCQIRRLRTTVQCASDKSRYQCLLLMWHFGSIITWCLSPWSLK